MNETHINNIVKDLSHFYSSSSDQFGAVYSALLEKKRKTEMISQVEYKFLSWLNHNDPSIFPVNFNIPNVPVPTFINHSNFVSLPFFNARRMVLYNKFRGYICDLNHYSINTPLHGLLIGGSFTDNEVENPSDIDLAILVDSEDMFIENTDSTLPGREPRNVIDSYFITKECDTKDYNTYTKLLILGNKAKVRDKDAEMLSNNIFTSIPVYNLTSYF